MLSVAERLPTAVGLKFALMMQEAPGARLVPQSFVCANDDAYVPVIPMLLTVNVTAPLLLSVVVFVPLIVPTATLPNGSEVGLTLAATVKLRARALLMPLALPEIVTEVVARTGLVVTSNEALIRACGTTMLVAIGFAKAALLLDRSTVTGPSPATHSSVAFPTVGLPPTTVVGVREIEDKPIGRTVSA
jgi:hypothetical protein